MESIDTERDCSFYDLSSSQIQRADHGQTLLIFVENKVYNLVNFNVAAI